MRKVISCLLLVSLCSCQLGNAGTLKSDVKRFIEGNLERKSDNLLEDDSNSSKCSLIIPEEIKASVPSDMQYNVFLQMIFNHIRSEYVRCMSEGEITERAIAGVLSALDPHSSYLNEKALASLRNQTEGEFCGLGIEIIMDEGFIRIISPIDDTPAYKAGIKGGDLIIYIDDECVNGFTAEDAIAKLRGKPNTKVKLKIKRGDKVPFDVIVERDVIKIQSVKTEVLNNIGYIRISTFDQNTSNSVRAFLSSHKKLSGIIIDVRNNPGGLLNEVVDVANMFMKGGKIVSTRGRTEENTKEFFADDSDLTGGIPVVVLINSSTASAPEILAGALQDNKRAIIVGTRSFGKGSVQKVIPLSNKTAIKLTVAKHYTPNGRCIQAKGIIPDIEADTAVIEKAKNQFIIREEFFNNALDVKENATYKSKTDADNKKSIDALNKKDIANDKDEDIELLYRKMSLKERVEKDYQLSKAFDVINVIKTFNSINNEAQNEKK